MRNQKLDEVSLPDARFAMCERRIEFGEYEHSISEPLVAWRPKRFFWLGRQRLPADVEENKIPHSEAFYSDVKIAMAGILCHNAIQGL